MGQTARQQGSDPQFNTQPNPGGSGSEKVVAGDVETRGLDLPGLTGVRDVLLSCPLDESPPPPPKLTRLRFIWIECEGGLRRNQAT